MSWRVVYVSSSSKLELKMGYVVIKAEVTRKIFIEEISVLVIENTASAITTSLIQELMNNKIVLVLCDSKHFPKATVLPFYANYDASAHVLSQTQWEPDIKQAVWAEIVREKIRKQAQCLRAYDLQEEQKVLSYVDQVEPGDPLNCEAHAARVYFNALYGHSFNRDDETDSLNFKLNYGYTVVLSCVAREIVANGYITQLGIFHHGPSNNYNLASDLIEPFRPLVDRIVKDLPQDDCFCHESKAAIINVLNQEVFISGRRQLVLNAIATYVKSVFVALEARDITAIRFYQYGF